MKISIQYYRDVWHDDHTTRLAIIDVKPGEIIDLHKAVDRMAYDTCNYAVLSVNGKRDCNWKRDPETRHFKLD
ncbi:MAG: hypothetical protein ACYTEQ_27320 [Planctomycetota bacterium]